MQRKGIYIMVWYAFILKKHGINHGIVTQNNDMGDDKKSHSNNEKSTQAYKLYSEGNKLVEVAIQLGFIS